MNTLTPHDLIQALRSLIKETPTIFAEPSDALYFRNQAKLAPLPKVATPPPKELPPSVEIKVQSKPPLPLESKQASPPSVEIKQAPLPSVEIKKTAPTFVPEVPLEKPPTKSFSSGSLLFTLFGKIAPHISIMKEIPSDTAAKKIAMRWKTRNKTAPISILSFLEPPKQKALLVEITKAIDVYFGPARLIEAEPIEKEKQWDAFLTDPNLKVIMACDYTLWQLENLMRSYKENSFEQTRMLGNIPLFLLPDLSLYLKDPLLKRSLWKGLCQKLSS
jgi:hypothetical protein